MGIHINDMMDDAPKIAKLVVKTLITIGLMDTYVDI